MMFTQSNTDVRHNFTGFEQPVFTMSFKINEDEAKYMICTIKKYKITYKTKCSCNFVVVKGFKYFENGHN